MNLKQLEISGFKSFAKKSVFEFGAPVSAVVGPNGSGKSNVAEAIRFVLGEQSMKSLRGKRGEDLIWSGSQNTPRSNHASVSIIFDNKGKKFDIDFDEVVLKREVSRDGVNRYFINGTPVRLKDIFEILAQVHIGATGHHIISQGEADRILSANIKDRRVMIEEALGLKIYQWKIAESEKKLSKTEENLRQVESLRREIAPHIKFLKRQVEKVERAKEMQSELESLYMEYLKKEEVYIAARSELLAEEEKEPKAEFLEIDGKIQKARDVLSKQENSDPKKEKLFSLESEINNARIQKEELGRNLGRIEGMIELEERRSKKQSEKSNLDTVSYSSVKSLAGELQAFLEEAEKNAGDVHFVKNIFSKMRETISGFFMRIQIVQKNSESGGAKEDESGLAEMIEEKNDLEKSLSDCNVHAKKLQEEYEQLKKQIEEEKDSSRDTEREMFEMMARKSELSATLEKINSEKERFAKLDNALKEEIKEGIVLVGRNISLYKNFKVSDQDVLLEERNMQEDRRKKIEKIKIKLEDMGAGGGEDIMKEYEEVTERDLFLAREIEDLGKSAESLGVLIKELSEKLDNDFKEGVQKINKQFQEFFALMFGGGAASLVVVAQKKRKRADTDILLDDNLSEEAMARVENEETEEGIDISVSLPRKKIKGLQMLSGGERALTSIALIFAVSQVNPPPFLVLDETDAALDEANSRKYGDMIEKLSKHSQLIVITHNRETMSRADILYGVTMGSDAVSKLLSVRFDEATLYAK